MRFQSVGFALSIGMALIAVLFGFTLLSAGGLVGFSANDAEAETARGESTPSLNEFTPPKKVKSARPVPAAIATEVAAGDALFKGNCAQCHAVDEVVVGPALAGITKRRPVAWLVPWVKNSSKVVASGDEYAVAIFNKYQKQQMPSFALSDTEIKAVLAYINSQEDQSPAIDDSGMAAVKD